MGQRLLHLGLLLVLAAGSSGCWWVVAGGAGAEAGYATTRDDRTTGETVSDQLLHTKVKAALIGASKVSSGRIDVKVRKGVVTLTGVLSSADEKSRAISAVRGVEGVKGVVDKLHVD